MNVMSDIRTLRSTVQQDDITADISKDFDYDFSGETTFTPPNMPAVRGGFGVGLIVGPSGSGKTTLLKRFGSAADVSWNDNKCVASHFATANEAGRLFSAVGLNSIPAWLRPFSALSTGEKFRADLARRLKSGAVVDEFTSVVDRVVARSCSNALARYVREAGLTNIVIASCHYDIIPWLAPDWVFDTKTGQMAGRGADRPSITVELYPCAASEWAAFSSHHYLSGAINRRSRCWLAVWDGVVVGFAAALAFPNGNFKNAWRGHRTVVLPDFQGLGMGVRISDAVASAFVADGGRFFSKTAHPRLGGYRDASPYWRATSKNHRARLDYVEGHKTKEDGHKQRHRTRVCYSHEFVGGQSFIDARTPVATLQQDLFA
jgi:ABC-type lipoprotein export system ATPase subunit/GNAT superfamily N-acetyltransferase